MWGEGFVGLCALAGGPCCANVYVLELVAELDPHKSSSGWTAPCIILFAAAFVRPNPCWATTG